MMRKNPPSIAQLDADEFDMWKALGGVRGLGESVVPGIVFVVVFILTSDLSYAIISSLSLTLIAVIVRLLSKTPLTQALSGLGGIIIGAIWAWRTGQAQDFFLWGLFVNAAFALGTLLTIAFKRPLVGLIIEGFSPGISVIGGARRIFLTASWLWAAAFLLRLAVQIPLYLNSSIGWLGTARVAMGLPLWALVLWVTWLLVRPVVHLHQRDGTPL